jgi:addiction module HigA family antidote
MIPRDDLHTLDLSDVTTGEALPNVTPGEVLREEFMLPLGLSARALARELGVPANRITAIVNGERAVTAETATLLAERLGTSREFWMHLQVAFDLEAFQRSRTARGPLDPESMTAEAIRSGRLREAASALTRRAAARTKTSR